MVTDVAQDVLPSTHDLAESGNIKNTTKLSNNKLPNSYKHSRKPSTTSNSSENVSSSLQKNNTSFNSSTTILNSTCTTIHSSLKDLYNVG